MTLLTEDVTPVQERIIRQNFDQDGPFFLGRDLHPMLDCACAPDGQVATGDDHSYPLAPDTRVGLQFDGKLREEFFGGILFDSAEHRHYMLDMVAYQMLRRLVGGHMRCGDLLGTAQSMAGLDRATATLAALVRQGIIGKAVGPAAVKHFPARDMSLAYLQSPIIVEVEVTYGCFRACRHCAYESSPEARTPGELSAEQWGTIFEKLADAGVLIVQLTGGDPLFRADSFDIVDAADAAGLSVYIRSDTAALSQSNIERLSSLRHLWHVGTSIDGADATQHDWMRGRGAFTVLGERVSTLAAAGIDVAAGATLHKSNYQTVREIGRRAAQFGARWFDIGFLSPVGRGANLQPLVLSGLEISESLGQYLDGVRDSDYEPSHAHYARRASRAKPFDDLGDLVSKLPYITEWPFSRLRIDPTGSSYTAGKLKGSDYAGGFNLQAASVERVWDSSPNLRQLRELGRGDRIHSLDYRLLRSHHEFL